MRLKGLFFMVLSISLLGFAPIGRDAIAQVSPAPITPPPYYLFPNEQQRFPNAASIPGDLLANGDMDDPAHRFYWRPTNHYVAGMWYEWWIGDVIPEFLDGGVPYHNICYPTPPDGKCYNKPYYNLSQGYILYNVNRYTAGVYQIVNHLNPCTLYNLTAYNSNEAAGYTSKVGLEPTGWSLPIPSWANPPDNCPPTGSSKCPDPRIDSEASFPTTMVWSPITTTREWHPLSVTAEAISTTMTAWLYASVPAGQISQSSYWDYASLVEQPFPDNRLPAPDSWEPSGFIQDLNAQWLMDTVVITWTTAEPASTQVWYTFAPGNDPTYEMTTPVDNTPKTTHRVVVEGIQQGGVTLRFTALSRRLQGGGCTTEAATGAIAIPERVPAPDSWEPSDFIQSLSARWLLDKVLIGWTTPESATTQVWYTLTPGNDTNYEMTTLLDTSPKTTHQVILDTPPITQPLRFAALSRHLQDDQYVTEAFTQTFETPERVPPPASWTPSEAIQNIAIVTGTNRIELTWETTLSTTTQAWYRVLPAPTPPTSHTLMLGFNIYLPFIAHTSFNFPNHTLLSVTPTLQHSAIITDLQEGETVSLVIVASYVNENQTITTLVSKIYNVGPFQGARQKLVDIRERFLTQ